MNKYAGFCPSPKKAFTEFLVSPVSSPVRFPFPFSVSVVRFRFPFPFSVSVVSAKSTCPMQCTGACHIQCIDPGYSAARIAAAHIKPKEQESISINHCPLSMAHDRYSIHTSFC